MPASAIRARVRASKISDSTTHLSFAWLRSPAQSATAQGDFDSSPRGDRGSRAFLMRVFWMSRSSNKVARACESLSVAFFSAASSARMMHDVNLSRGNLSKSRREHRSPVAWTTLSLLKVGGRLRWSRAFARRSFCSWTSRPEKRWSSEPDTTKSSSN